MTPDILLVLVILVVAFALFVTEWIRMDIVALFVLGVLAITGLVTPKDALSGFGNPAVVTVWAMFMLSAGLTQTGVANLIGRHVLRLAGKGEVRMILVIMVTAGVLSAFMNNIGVAALMLPVVMDVARVTGHPPSRLLMPLAYGSLLGGLTTLIGTPPNLLVSEALRDGGLEPFRLFDFTPVGGAVMLAGAAFVALVGRHLLPRRDPGRESSAEHRSSLHDEYAIHERTVRMRLRSGSTLIGRSLQESRLGAATGLNVLAVRRGGKAIPMPPPGFALEEDDALEVQGRLDRFDELRGWRELILEPAGLSAESLVSDEIDLAELRLSAGSELVGRSIGEAGIRTRFGLLVLALSRGSQIRYTALADAILEPGDQLLIQGHRARIAEVSQSSNFDGLAPAPPAELVRRYRLDERIFEVRVPGGSVLVGKSLRESRLGDALALAVLGVVREGRSRLLPDAEERIQKEDRLLVRGRREDLEVFRGLQELEIEELSEKELGWLESGKVGLVEATLSPRSNVAGRSLRQLDFRARYGLQALAILREGRAYRSDLRDKVLRFGDVLLLLGPQDKAALLAREPDFIVLTESLGEVQRTDKAPVATLIMAGVLLPVLFGWTPIAIAAVIGAALMVLVGCLTMEEAYRAVEWRAIFLIAGMLPLGIAMEQTGAASFLAERIVGAVGPFGPWGVILGLTLATAAATMIIPTAALVVLMAPIVLKASADVGISPHAVMMAVAIAASASFTSPISHPANLLVMGPGGYRFVDYVKVGVPLTIVILIVAMLILPFVWPLQS